MMSRPICCGRFLSGVIVLLAVLSCQPSSAGETYLRKWPDDIPTPTFNLIDLDGKQWNLQNLRGKVVVLNFWASWCAPCVDELPFLNDLASGSEAAKGQLVILGVNFKESTPAIQRFLNAHSFRYPIVVDKTGEHFKNWTNGVMPTTILIGRDGRPRWRVVGELNPADESFKQALEKMLEEPRQRNTRQPESVVNEVHD
jgi:thiol-disulfide isomerase/thioredoxin